MTHDPNRLPQPTDYRPFVLEVLLDDLHTYEIPVCTLAGTWRGRPFHPASVLWSLDREDWSVIGRAPESAGWGQVITPPAPPACPWSWQEDGEMVVQMQGGDERMSSLPPREVLEGGNAGALLTKHGVAEVIQWQWAEPLDGHRFRLRRLLRGRRGTEQAIPAAKEVFVLLESGAIRQHTVSPDLLHVPGYMAAAGAMNRLKTVVPFPCTIRGTALQPLSPVHVRGRRDYTGGLTATWVRRTRVGGQWRNGTGHVPLGEDLELYETDILRDDGSVARTFVTETAKLHYPAAAQRDDFGDIQPAIRMAIHQISVAVGRGHPREVVL